MADETQDAWERAKLLLDAQFMLLKQTQKPGQDVWHVRDIPAFAIERMVTDLMHYAHERNKGLQRGDGDYIEFEYILRDAKKQFIKEREAAPEHHEPLLDPRRPQLDPRPDELQTKLYARQLAELTELDKKQKDETARLGASRQLEQQHDRERASLTQKFEQEREKLKGAAMTGPQFTAKVPFTADPEYKKLMSDLQARQEREVKDLTAKQMQQRIEANKANPSRQQLDDNYQHDLRQRDELSKRHKAEHDRYIREYHDAKVLREELREKEKTREQTDKLTR